MAIIIDTGVFIEGEKNTFALERWIESHPNDNFEIAAITIAELWHGVERAADPYRQARKRYVEAVVRTFPSVPYTEATALEHARLWAELAATGNMIGAYDLIVAATALERGSPVATFNVRHFSRVRGLTVIEPR